MTLVLKLRSRPFSQSQPVINAAIGNAIKYPPVGPSKRTMPNVPPANTGMPAAPCARYARTARAPRLLPRAAPVSKTPKVCKVTGTVVKGRSIEIWAVRARKMLKQIINTMSRSKGVLLSLVRGKAWSARVICGASVVAIGGILEEIDEYCQ